MMKRFILIGLLIIFAGTPIWSQIPRTMSYQSVLTNASGDRVTDGNYALQFSIYDNNSGGTALWTETQTIHVSDGIINATLGKVTPLSLSFDKPYWLGISINGGTELAPRIELTSSAYSLNARTVSDSSVTDKKIANGQVVRSINTLKDHVTLAAGNNVQITQSDYTITISATGTGAGESPPAWGLTGNSGTVDGTNYLGTADNVPMNFRVNGSRAFRLEPNDKSPNIIGGFPLNAVSPDLTGGTIAGGGYDGWENIITDDFGTIGGGAGNQTGDDLGTTEDATYATVGGGFSNEALALSSTVAGGNSNTAGEHYSSIGGGAVNKVQGGYGTISGGTQNTIKSDLYGTIGGGIRNETMGDGATISGGGQNLATDLYTSIVGGFRNTAGAYGASVLGGADNKANAMFATAAGGQYNEAKGQYSFSAGYRAKSNHSGTFVWADNTDADFTSTDGNQFLIRSYNGVGINKNDPEFPLDVAGVVQMTGFKMPQTLVEGYVLTSDATGVGSWQPVGTNFIGGNGTQGYIPKFTADKTITTSLIYEKEGKIGIGHSNPPVKLYVDQGQIAVIGETGKASAIGLKPSGHSGYQWYIANAYGGKLVFNIGYLDEANNGSDWDNSRLALLNNGNIGIGTVNPNSKLEVAGTIHSTTGGFKFPDGTTQTTAAAGGSSDNHSLDAADGNPTNVVYVANDGRVGVNNNAPEYLFHVKDGVPQDDKPAIYGQHDVDDYYGIGVKGVGGYIGVKGNVEGNSDESYHGVYGEASGDDGVKHGVRGEAYGVRGKNYGVDGEAIGNEGSNYGVYGYAYGENSNNYGVYGSAAGGGTNYAGYFVGDTFVSGTLTKGAGAFKIDHPLDPENKTLCHSFVESPDMMNIYNGNVMLDNNGEAVVTLPDWFGALNKDFRYQLTCIGGFAQVFIAEEISNNRFKIAGGVSGLKISWQVTGVRKDAFAEAHRIEVESEKPADQRGRFIHPEAYRQPENRGIDYFNKAAVDEKKQTAGR